MRATVTNPTFELAYWASALDVAQHWRTLLGLDPEPLWTEVAANMVRPHVRGGVYAAVDVPPCAVTDDHSSMLYALGVVPATDLVDPDVMRDTLHGVLSKWEWETIWGWDYSAIATTATRGAAARSVIEA